MVETRGEDNVEVGVEPDGEDALAELPDPALQAGVSPGGPGRAAAPRSVLGVLPWRRWGEGDPLVDPIVRLVRSHHPKADVRPVTRAYEIARLAHEGQQRKSGEEYIAHPVAVASILADLGMDVTTVVAGLLHDAVEDTPVSMEEVRGEFGDDVAEIVDGVTKLDRLRFDTKEAQQAATMRKMLVAMAKDIRVLLIKLADRLHNMRTLHPLEEPKRRRIAQETLDIYAPLAHRLGIQEMKWQLEDLAFCELYPKAYHEIEAMVRLRHDAREQELDDVVEILAEKLEAAKVKASVKGRPKHYWSIYDKMVRRQRSFDDIYDLIGVRVLVDSVRDCYGALGLIHSVWKPVLGRFKDYIAMPKFNLYQALHTTVMGPEGKPIEIQIRTRDMHRTAEYGIAAHWQYKEDGGARKRTDELVWLRHMIDWQEDTADPKEFMETLKVDLYQDEVFAFTPQGDVVTLNTGATPIDFAYAIHTEVGHRCIGARVNDRLVPLDTKLSSGDTVEIFTSKVEGAGPSRDWLQVVATARARNKIRAWFSRERREEAVEAGRDLVVKAMRRARQPVQKLVSQGILEEIAEDMNYSDVGALHAAVGEGHVTADSVAARVARRLSEAEPAQAIATVERPVRRTRSAETAGVHVEGLDDVWVKLARCCNPVPGDEIMGFVTRGRGVSVHRTDCANASALGTKTERLIEVEWDSDSSATAIASVQIEALDRERLLRDVTTVLSDHHVNIVAAQTATGKDQVAVLRFEFEVADPSRLESVLNAIRKISSVYEAYRVMPGSGRIDKGSRRGY